MWRVLGERSTVNMVLQVFFYTCVTKKSIKMPILETLSVVVEGDVPLKSKVFDLEIFCLVCKIDYKVAGRGDCGLKVTCCSETSNSFC